MPLTLLQKFKEAMQSREVRKAMPTDMTSAELEQLPAEIMERAVVSAQTMSTQYLDAAEKQIRDILNPHTEERLVTSSPTGEQRHEVFTAGTNKSSARLELKKVWEALGYEAPEGKAGTIQDLSSDARIDLVIDTNVDMARGYGQWRQGQDEDVLDLWPCQELFRAEARKVERDWISRWKQASAVVGDYDALKALPRMIARKDSPIWEELSRFHTPYPPFDFNSGMWVRDVSREEAVEFGIMGEWDRVTPQRRGFESDGEAPAPRLANAYNPDEPRDEQGQWTEESGMKARLGEIAEKQKTNPDYGKREARTLTRKLAGENVPLTVEMQGNLDRIKKGGPKPEEVRAKREQAAKEFHEQKQKEISEFEKRFPHFSGFTEEHFKKLPEETQKHFGSKEGITFQGEPFAPGIKHVERIGGGGVSSISESMYPMVRVHLDNGTHFDEQIRISGHAQVSSNAPRTYDVDVRVGKFQDRPKDWKEIQPKLHAALADKVLETWEEHRQRIARELK
jgi:hypothetical protein